MHLRSIAYYSKIDTFCELGVRLHAQPIPADVKFETKYHRLVINSMIALAHTLVGY